MTYNDCIEKLTLYFSTQKYMTELIDAKEVFFNEVGVDSALEQEFEYKHNVFFDWYLLSRSLNGTTQTPAQLALDIENFDTSIEPSRYKALANAKFGLFELLKIKKRDYTIRDILSKEKYLIKESEVELLAEKGAYFHTHLILDESNNSFSKSLIFHSMEARKSILKLIKNTQLENEDQKYNFYLDLMSMYFKYEKYPHLAIEQIYNEQSPVKF